MSVRRSASLLLLIATLAVPSAALAQNAGDEQYSDPLQSEQTTTDAGDATGTTDASGDVGSEMQQSVAQPTAGDTAAPTTTAAADELARTGLDLRLLAGFGVVLLAVGLGLRRGGHARR